MCSGSEAGSYLRPIDFVYHSTLGVRVIKKKKKFGVNAPAAVKKLCCERSTPLKDRSRIWTWLALFISNVHFQEDPTEGC